MSQIWLKVILEREVEILYNPILFWHSPPFLELIVLKYGGFSLFFLKNMATFALTFFPITFFARDFFFLFFSFFFSLVTFVK